MALSATMDQAAPSPRARERLQSSLELLAEESLPIVVAAVFVGLLAVLVPNLLSSDGWLALVGGRLIAHHGLPQHDTLAALTHGREWVDQQWLGQLGAYAVATAGGMKALLAVNVALVGGSFAAAMAVARRRGGRPTTVACVGLFALLPFLVTAMNVRTQSAAYPLFVLVVVLAARPEPVGIGRAAVILATVVFWANVHGSVLFAAVLVTARGAVQLLRAPRSRVGWALLVGPWFCVLASPYHIHLVSYYTATALNPSFSSYLSQWAPTRFSAISAPLLVLLFAAIWLLGRVSAVYSTYERVLLVAAVAAGLLAVRNWPFAVLLVLQLAPVGFDRALRRRSGRPAPGIGAVIALGSALAAVGGMAAAVAHAEHGLAKRYPASAANAAARAAESSGGTVYGGIQYSDWLLWSHPELAGRVAFDVRYELLDHSEVKRLALFDAGSGLDRPLGAPSVYMLDKDSQEQAVSGLRPDVRVVEETEHLVVAVSRKPE